MVLFISFEVDSDAMGCACSKKAVVDDDPLPNLSAKVSRQSSARYLCASIQHNISQPLSGLLTAVKDNEEKVRVQYNHHHHYQQQQQQQHIHLNNQRQPQDQLIKPKYNAQHSDLARTVSSRRRAREAERERTASENIRNIPKHNEGEQVAAGWPAWLSAVAGEAIKGWIPRRADSFEKLDKVQLFHHINASCVVLCEFCVNCAVKYVHVSILVPI